MTDWMQQAAGREWLSDADRHLARYLLELEDGEPSQASALLTALTSAQIREGNVCLPLRDNPMLAELGVLVDLDALAMSGIVGRPGESGKPLILDDDRLYLARYHVWERQVIDAIQRLLAAAPPVVDVAALQRGLEEQFGVDPGLSWQRVAAALAVTQRFTIISGGPGTGKTWTLARILSLLQQQPGGAELRVALAAPTGKAAARMSESIANADSALAERLGAAQTLHRLLGMRPGRVQPRHHADNPLPVDLLIVDEVSMVDLPMMARLLAALPAEARLILLGDRFQLASVEAGQVMADLCGDAGECYSDAVADRVASLSGDALPRSDKPQPPMADHLVVLRDSRRFDPDKGIGRLASAVNRGDAEAALDALRGDATEIALADTDAGTLRRLLRSQVVPLFTEIRKLSDPAQALQQLEAVRVLCAVREGPLGVHQVNASIENDLGIDGHGLYHGQPVMVVVNDYGQQLFNGDIGLVLRDAQGRLRVHFNDGQGGIRTILPSRLPSHETVYAMTIHKSQGSEFEQVILVLPDEASPVVTRELLYTGITRARKKITLCASPASVEQAIQRRVRRISGLYQALWGAMQEPADECEQ